MDSSKPRGILASLEHKAAEPPRRPGIAAPSAARGALMVVSGGIMVSAVLAWWLYSGPSPLMVDEVLPSPPAFSQAAPVPAPASAPSADTEAAAIVDEAPPPASAPSPALAAVLAPTPIATVVMRREQVAARAHPKPKPKPKQVTAARREQPRSPPRAAPDTDVALLSAIVAHAAEHDVIEARAGDSTASLLQRCRRVGGEEGRLCGLRICATRAGDQACHVE
ncbi:hypothetical protein [Massilia sp. METH4]|uniref:hypothetical protein n=1 Tax=Massilia sp. METH4 TaxID=3123041 RepID=UPI0030CCF22E